MRSIRFVLTGGFLGAVIAGALTLLYVFNYAAFWYGLPFLLVPLGGFVGFGIGGAVGAIIQDRENKEDERQQEREVLRRKATREREARLDLGKRAAEAAAQRDIQTD
jgi:hypothetical protein